MTPAYVAELNLLDTAWLTSAHGKWRNSWRKSQKSNLEIEHETFDAALHEWVLIEDRQQQRRKKYRALPHSIIHAFASISPRNVIVFSARKKNKNVAAMLFLQHGQVATYHVGWSSAAGREDQCALRSFDECDGLLREKGRNEIGPWYCGYRKRTWFGQI